MDIFDKGTSPYSEAHFSIVLSCLKPSYTKYFFGSFQRLSLAGNGNPGPALGSLLQI